MSKNSTIQDAMRWEMPIGGSKMFQYAMIKKMELTGVGTSLEEHIGCPVDYHIKYCMPLMRCPHDK